MTKPKLKSETFLFEHPELSLELELHLNYSYETFLVSSTEDIEADEMWMSLIANLYADAFAFARKRMDQVKAESGQQ